MPKRKPTKRAKWVPLDVWQGASTRYYWRLVAKNGRLVADGGEGYSSEAKARQGFRAAAKLAAKALAEMEGG